MSEIIYVLLSAFWILGLSLVLSVLAIAGYLAGENHQPLRQQLSTSTASLAITLGAVLFCAGLAGLTGPLWQKILWGLLGLGFIANSVWEHIEKSTSRK